MWHDNETDVDLLGFDQLVDTASFLVEREELLPLTVGVFGDWGSGKSSLMRMVYDRLEGDERYVCVHFSPWQHEGYDDVKAALMAAVMTTLRDRRDLFEKLGEGVAEGAKGLWVRLARRVDWFRTIGFAAKGLGAVASLGSGNPLGAGLAVGSVDDLRHIVRPEQLQNAMDKVTDEKLLKDPTVEVTVAGQAGESIHQSVGEFRRDFEALLERLEVKALVVFIDDLDRCLPTNVLDTVEAVRLFLAVPKTAFVVGADERIVRHAIATRYPELPGQAVNIGRDYLEKIIQVPIRIPPMTPPEAETYLNLLGCALHLEDKDEYESMVDLAARNRREASLGVAMNYGIAESNLSEVPAVLAEYMQLVGRIAPTLGGGMRGNPRQVKRFMNTLLLRQRLAEGRGITLDAAVLAKLMILEYLYEAYFRQLFQWHVEGEGVVAQLEELEGAIAREGEEAPVAAGARRWLEDKNVHNWLRLEPPLAGKDLEQYFYFSRDKIFTVTAPSRRLSQQLQELLGKLQSESAAQRRSGSEEAATLSSEEFRPVYEELLGQFERDPRALDSKLGPMLAGLAKDKSELVAVLAQTLGAVPPTAVQPALPAQIRNTFGANEPLPREIEDVIQGWADQDAAKGLAGSARTALRDRRR